jgi:DNA repair exonuclease SbcCD ATPase subunit
MSEEEMALLEEELASARSDVEALQERLADVEAKAATQAAEAAELRRQAAAAESLLGRAEQAEAMMADAARRYRDLALRSEPDLPPELVTGTTFDEVEESLSRARETVARVRQRLEESAQAARVPPGAPARAEPDINALSAAEKIRLGLQDR